MIKTVGRSVLLVGALVVALVAVSSFQANQQNKNRKEDKYGFRVDFEPKTRTPPIQVVVKLNGVRWDGWATTFSPFQSGGYLPKGSRVTMEATQVQAGHMKGTIWRNARVTALCESEQVGVTMFCIPMT